jgi:thymidylate synthase (FAD)
MSVKLLFITPDYAKTIEYAARTSTATECKENSEEFVRRLVKKGHLSVGRHCNASFEIICSRACSHQLVRHTHLVYTQESQRYVEFDFDDGDYANYIIPQTVANNKNCVLWGHAMTQIRKTYKGLIESGVPKEDARYILPNACLTRLVVSGNFQAFYDFIKLRTDKAAQWEIRNIAEEIRDILLKECPAFFDLLIKDLELMKEFKKWKKNQ